MSKWYGMLIGWGGGEGEQERAGEIQKQEKKCTIKTHIQGTTANSSPSKGVSHLHVEMDQLQWTLSNLDL